MHPILIPTHWLGRWFSPCTCLLLLLLLLPGQYRLTVEFWELSLHLNFAVFNNCLARALRWLKGEGKKRIKKKRNTLPGPDCHLSSQRRTVACWCPQMEKDETESERQRWAGERYTEDGGGLHRLEWRWTWLESWKWARCKDCDQQINPSSLREGL